jgi:hypothetical protein
VARRHDIVVPSLLADIAQPGDDPDPDVIVHAEEKVEAVVDLAVEGVVDDAAAARAESSEEVVS